MNDLVLACLAGELYHVSRLRRRWRDAPRHGDPAWTAHCAERVDAQNARIRALLATGDPARLLTEARALLAQPVRSEKHVHKVL